jgi:hypothetical protein
MSRNALKNQDRPTKMCECGRNQVYTDNRPGVPRLDGKLVCEDCFVEDLINKSLNRRAE